MEYSVKALRTRSVNKLSYGGMVLMGAGGLMSSIGIVGDFFTHLRIYNTIAYVGMAALAAGSVMIAFEKERSFRKYQSEFLRT